MGVVYIPTTLIGFVTTVDLSDAVKINESIDQVLVPGGLNIDNCGTVVQVHHF
jgi:uncharacterized surface protein with fasciclin (FAS1) repeats